MCDSALIVVSGFYWGRGRLARGCLRYYVVSVNFVLRTLRLKYERRPPTTPSLVGRGGVGPIVSSTKTVYHSSERVCPSSLQKVCLSLCTVRVSLLHRANHALSIRRHPLSRP